MDISKEFVGIVQKVIKIGFIFCSIKERQKMADINKPKRKLDCIGLYCPEPLFRTRKAIDSIEVGEILEVLADDPAAEEDLKRLAKRTGQEVVEFEKKGDILRFLIKRVK